jgi:hypothetical protein
MKIVNVGSDYVLIKNNLEEVCVNIGNTIQYQGIYHKLINDIEKTVKIETAFIGIIEFHKYRHDQGTIGIYVKPLYIWNKMKEQWNKIINYKQPTRKYFLYPHLLMVDKKFGQFEGLHNLDTIVSICLDDFPCITQCFDLGIES